MKDLLKFAAVLAITALAIVATFTGGLLVGVVVWFGLVILGHLVERTVERRTA